MYWIRLSIQEKQEKFDFNVAEALNRVSRKLEGVEDKKNKDFDLEFKASGFDEYHQPVDGDPKINEGVISEEDRTRRYKALEKQRQRASYRDLINGTPLGERINLDDLNVFLKNELSNQAINIAYDYGVYDREEKSFVIINGHYVVQDKSPLVLLAGNKNIYNSQYRVDLFPSELQSPGLVMVAKEIIRDENGFY